MTGIARTDTSLLGQWWWTVDRWTLAAVAALMGFGVILILAATPPVAERIGLGSFHLAQRHLALLPLALLVLFLVSLLTRGADLSPATLIEAAAIHGFTISIKEYFPESVPADLPLSNAFKHDVTVDAEIELIVFMTGVSRCGDPLGKVEQTELECLLDEIEPAYAERVLIP